MLVRAQQPLVQSLLLVHMEEQRFSTHRLRTGSLTPQHSELNSHA